MSDTSVVVVEIDGGTTVIEVPGAMSVVDVGSFGDPGPAGPAGPAGPPGAPGAPGDWSTAQTVDFAPGPAYTVVTGDAGRLKLTDATTITLPSGIFTMGQRVDFSCGFPCTFVLGSGATWTILPTPSAVTRAAGSFASVVKMGTTGWGLTGDLA